MPKCPNCPQFTSKETDNDAELDLNVDSDGLVTGTARIANTCADCGEELEETTFEIECDFSAAVSEHRDEHAKQHGKKTGEHTLEVDGDASRSDDTKTVDRRGKKIRNPRYWKRYYGVDVTITVTCSCGEQFTDSTSDSVQASGMDALV